MIDLSKGENKLFSSREVKDIVKYVIDQVFWYAISIDDYKFIDKALKEKGVI